MVHLSAASEQFGENLVIISISIDPEYDTVERLQTYRTEKNISWTIARDTQSNVKTDFNVTSGNTLFLIDWEGYIQKRFEGEVVDEFTLSEEIIAIPEFPAVIVPFLFMVFALVAVISGQKIQSTRKTVFGTFQSLNTDNEMGEKPLLHCFL